jgi:hypothetical protein
MALCLQKHLTSRILTRVCYFCVTFDLQEFDPDMFDRLLEEFDPDVEPLMDDAMYQQFLQVCHKTTEQRGSAACVYHSNCGKSSRATNQTAVFVPGCSAGSLQ